MREMIELFIDIDDTKVKNITEERRKRKKERERQKNTKDDL